MIDHVMIKVTDTAGRGGCRGGGQGALAPAPAEKCPQLWIRSNSVFFFGLTVFYRFISREAAHRVKNPQF